MRCLREQKWERKKRQNAGGAPELRYRSHEPSNKRWCPENYKAKGQSRSSGVYAERLLVGRCQPFSWHACAVTLLYFIHLPHPRSSPERTVALPRSDYILPWGKERKGYSRGHSTGGQQLCLLLVSRVAEQGGCPATCLSGASGPKCAESSSGPRAVASAPSCRSLYLVPGSPGGMCGKRRLWGPVSRDPGRQNQEAAWSSQTPWLSGIRWQQIPQMPRSNLWGLFLRCTSLFCFSAKALFQSSGTVCSLLELRTIFRKQHVKPFSNWL